jgi:hypothetical protein
MLNKISGLCRTLYVVVAIVAAFVTMGAMDTALVLVVLGLIAGISMPRDRMVLAAVSVVALPMVGAALGHIPTVGAQLTAITANLQLGIAGALATAMVMFMYDLAMDGVTGITGAAAGGGRKRATT